MSKSNGAARPTNIRDVLADDALIDAMGAAPLGRGPRVPDHTDGELIDNVMVWRRQLEDEVGGPSERLSQLDDVLGTQLAQWVDAPRLAGAVAALRAAIAPLCLSAPLPPAGLAVSQRQLDVLAGMARGLSNGQIGRELFLSEDTVKTSARRLFRAVGARDRAHAVARGYQLGILTLPRGA